jgi:hypothetical protein
VSRPKKRLPIPIVLALASAMVSVGVLATVLALAGTPESTGAAATATSSDDTEPRLVAEDFLDAWRRRDHERALAIATGEAAQAVRERRDADSRLPDEDRSVKEQLWDPMASERLALEIDREDLREGGLALSGRAVGTFVGRPYEREVAFELVREGERYRVGRMELGAILTETPDFLEIEGAAGTTP